MEQANLVVLCCQCKIYKKQENVRKVKIENISAEPYICLQCIEAIPELSEHTEPLLKKYSNEKN
jgi:hypothetical protein